MPGAHSFLAAGDTGALGGASSTEPACQRRRRKRRGLTPFSGRPLEGDMATHAGILAWRIPWTEEPAVYGVTQTWIRLKRLSTRRRHVVCEGL